MKSKTTRFIMLYAPRGFRWVGRQLLFDKDTYDKNGKYIHTRCSYQRDFRTIRKARNVLMAMPKGKGAFLYKEYVCRKKGKLVTTGASGYEFNSLEDMESFDKRNNN